MTKYLCGILTAMIMLAGSAFGVPVVIAFDEADNYTTETFIDGSNEGFGFGEWDFWNIPASLGDSTEGGGGDINSDNGYSFRFMADGDNGWSNARRNFASELNTDDVLSFQFTYNYDGGGRGVDIFCSTGQFANVIDVSGGNSFKVNGVEISTEWSPGAVVEVEITQLEDGVQVYLSRTTNGVENLNYTTNIVNPEAATGFSLYCGGYATNEFAPNNVDFAIFMNDIQITGTVEPALTLSGRDAMPANWTNTITVTRNGELDDPLTVTLASSDTDVATVPATVDILATEASATFELVGVDLGVSEITANAAGFPQAVLEVVVYDIAYDDSSYYNGNWTDASNGGLGFGEWALVENTDGGLDRYAGHFLGNSIAGGPNVNARASGDAFGMYANGAENPLATATRSFTELGIGETIGFAMGVNFLNGAKGASLWNNETELLEVGAYSEGYWYQNKSQGAAAVSLGWDYAADSAIEVRLSRHDDTLYSLWIWREGSAEEDNLINGVILSNAPNAIRFFIADTESGDQNNLYFNSMAIFSGVYGDTNALTLTGPSSLYVGNTGVYTVARVGNIDDTVEIGNTDPAVLSAPLNVTFPGGVDVTTFEAVALAEGDSTLTVYTLSVISDPLAVTVTEEPEPPPPPEGIYDDATYYPGGWTNNANGGAGYGPWTLNAENGDTFIGDATEQGPNNAAINTNDVAFGMWTDTPPAEDPPPHYVNASRDFESALNAGDVFTFQLAFKYDNGNRGFTLYDGDGEVFFFDINDGGYFWTGDGAADPTPWEGARENGVVLDVEITATATGFDYSVTSAQDAFLDASGTIASGALVGFQLYISNAGGGADANFYANRFEVVQGDVGPGIESIYINMGGEIEFTIPEGYNLFSVEGAELVVVGDGFEWVELTEDVDYGVNEGVVTILTNDDGQVIRVKLLEDVP